MHLAYALQGAVIRTAKGMMILQAPIKQPLHEESVHLYGCVAAQWEANPRCRILPFPFLQIYALIHTYIFPQTKILHTFISVMIHRTSYEPPFFRNI